MGVDPVAAGAGREQVFVSYAGADRPWAQWAASVLESAGYVVELDVWDWLPGANTVLAMNDVLAKADRVLALWSRAYFERERFTTDEWTAEAARRPGPDGQRHRLIPVRVQDVTPPGLATDHGLPGHLRSRRDPSPRRTAGRARGTVSQMPN
jgi:hypothetical protein